MRCQGASETGNVSHPSAHGAPTDLQNRHSRGQVPAECLEQKMLYAYTTVCTQGTSPWAENEKKAIFSFCPSPTIYNKQVTWSAGAKQARHGYPLSSMKMHQANAGKCGVGGIMVPSTNCLWSPFWSPSICLENGITNDILFTMWSHLKYHKT